MKSNVIAAALLGLGLGIAAELFFAFVETSRVLACLFTPIAWLLGLGLPILIGALAAAWSKTNGLMTAPTGILDGALAAAFAELISRLVGFCASVVTARTFFAGPRFLLPGVEPAARTLAFSVWEIGWLVVSVIAAALLGALGGFLYAARGRR